MQDRTQDSSPGGHALQGTSAPGEALLMGHQRAEHRDTQAIHAKLDELLRASGRARNELAWLDDKEPETIEQHRERARRDDKPPA